jgi:hypothetical protein
LGGFLAHQAGVARRRQAAFAGDEFGREVVQVLIRRLERRRGDGVAGGQ